MRARIPAVPLALTLAVFAAGGAQAQLWQLTPEQLIQRTAKSPFERFPDSRPKVPEALLEKLRTTDIGIDDLVGAMLYLSTIEKTGMPACCSFRRNW